MAIIFTAIGMIFVIFLGALHMERNNQPRDRVHEEGHEKSGR